uniref:FAD dependent oxidoreductase domain-containing protein n=1 Tax=Bionectria ochroleuca TaxID=29856 RepID=A0A8H7N8E9_BIOOC
MVTSTEPPTIAVIGAGVIGLSAALKIQSLLSGASAQARVVLIAREWPTSIPGAPIAHSPDYASMWAGAHVRPIPAGDSPQLQREARWLKQTVAEFEELLRTEPSVGITRTPGIEFLDAPPPDYVKQTEASFVEETGLAGYRKYAASELPEGVQLGYEYETYCVNSPLYCGNLLRKFIVQGGKTLQRDLKSEWEAFAAGGSNVKLVVNASGTGFGDWRSFPTRGQTVITNVLSATKTVTRQNKDGTWSFIIPRFFNGGTIIGGTKEPGNWQVEPRPSTREVLLAGGKGLAPYATSDSSPLNEKDLRVITDVVGRRPTREGGVRIELEEKQLTDANGQLRTGHVLHSYGAGGRGYEISWGVANEVSEVVKDLLPLIVGTKAKL